MIEFRLPSLGADMDEGKLLQWLVKSGDEVKKGQIVCIVDTAKAALDVECWHDGTVHALLVEPGTTIPVGTLMAVLREPGESPAAVDEKLAQLARGRPAPVAAAPVPAPVAAPPPARAPAAAPVPSERRRVSPAARRRAAELGIDIDRVAAGADGTVSIEDVERAARAAAPAEPPVAPTAAAERAVQMRKVIASAMARSKREIPHYYLAEDIPLAAATAWLAERNAQRSVTDRLLLASLLLKAVASALRRYPEFNGYLRDGAFEPGAGIHIGVAISLRAGGLVTPALHDADRKDIDAINRALLDLTQRARAGSLKLAELTDATITVTSLGDRGVASVWGVIFPPQVAIVGFGRVTERPWVLDGEVRALPVVTASLSADHRASDGHRGGLLLAAIRDRLQAPDELAKETE
ncbi:MAG: 2-oxo acid dehydrogenase subunit E2 [Burkholderiaceae bacterium]|nr:2-oxo acid dehydrogenase subunit E2 [Burkholderiaceae bacterium]